jgi:hypothetical protein
MRTGDPRRLAVGASIPLRRPPSVDGMNVSLAMVAPTASESLKRSVPMNENQSQTESLLDIVRSVKDETLLLPEFQRDFRWEMDQSYDLFDSLIREIFIGTIIYGKPGFGMTLRQIDDRPRKGKGSRAALRMRHYDKDEIVAKSRTQNLRIILDGQQRITSIYRALTGADNVFVILRADLKPEDLVERPLEQLLGEIAGEQSEDAISVRLNDAYRAEVESLEDEDLDAQFSETAFALQVGQDHPSWKSFARMYRRAVKKIIDLYKKQKLVAFHLLDMTLDKFCLFFERSNSRGIQLNFTDILAAKLYHGFNLRQKIEEFEGQHNLRLNRETIVRTVAYFTAMEKGTPVTIDKKAILENLEPEDFVRHWDRASAFYKDGLDYLVTQHFVLNRNWLPSENMVIPLMVFLSHVKGFDRIHEEQRKFLEFWFWSSVFANRYSMASNEVIISDSQALAHVAQGKRIERRDYFTRLRSLVTDPEDLFIYTKRTSAIYRGVLNLIGYAIHGLRDWRSTQKIDPDKDLDDHHIYPRAYIASGPLLDLEAGEAVQLMDCVVNRTLIPKNLNISIGKRPPQSYLADLKKQNPKLEASLQDHLVPPELVTDPAWNKKFRDFLDTRARSIMGLIERYALEPAKEMEARYAAALDGGEPSRADGADRLAKGLRTPESAFVLPILQALQELGGQASMQQVLEKVGAAMGNQLRDVDYQPLKSDPNRPRWNNTAQWARNTMVAEGLLRNNSPRGIWEIADAGRKFLRTKSGAG